MTGNAQLRFKLSSPHVSQPAVLLRYKFLATASALPFVLWHLRSQVVCILPCPKRQVQTIESAILFWTRRLRPKRRYTRPSTHFRTNLSFDVSCNKVLTLKSVLLPLQIKHSSKKKIFTDLSELIILVILQICAVFVENWKEAVLLHREVH